jgi:hypothetical protein
MCRFSFGASPLPEEKARDAARAIMATAKQSVFFIWILLFCYFRAETLPEHTRMEASACLCCMSLLAPAGTWQSAICMPILSEKFRD